MMNSPVTLKVTRVIFISPLRLKAVEKNKLNVERKNEKSTFIIN